MGYLKNNKKQRQIILVIIDLVTLFLTTTILGSIFNLHFTILTLLFFGGGLVCLLYVFGAYGLTLPRQRGLTLIGIVMAVTLADLSIYPFLSEHDSLRVSYLIAESTLLIVILSYLHIVVSRNIEQRKPSVTVFICSDQTYQRFTEIRHEVERDYRIDYLSDVRASAPSDIIELMRKAGSNNPDIIVFDDTVPVDNEVAKYLLHHKSMGHKTLSFIDFCSAVTGRVPLDMVDFHWFVREGALKSQNVYSKRLKRVLDLTVGLILCSMAMVPMALVALAIRVEDGGPVLFRQSRLGQHGKEFVLYKFRSMFNDAEKDGPKWSSEKDPRITRVGRFIRKTRLDELPQFINVIRGDISLVGPRPIRRHFTDIIAAEYPLYELRILVKPGITGWAQVLGPYGVNMEEEAQKLEMDLYYLKNADLIHDLYIIMKTARIMLAGKGT